MIQIAIISFSMTLMSGVIMLWALKPSLERTPNQIDKKVSEIVR